MATLLSNGGLGLTDLSLRQKSGTSWIAAASYAPNQEYRLTVRLLNLYPPVNYGGLASRHVVYLYPVGFVIRLTGATFTGASSGSSAMVFADCGAGEAHVDDKHPLQNSTSRTYHVYFRWSSSVSKAATAPVDIGLRGGEVCSIPNMSWVPLRPAG